MELLIVVLIVIVIFFVGSYKRDSSRIKDELKEYREHLKQFDPWSDDTEIKERLTRGERPLTYKEFTGRH